MNRHTKCVGFNKKTKKNYIYNWTKVLVIITDQAVVKTNGSFEIRWKSVFDLFFLGNSTNNASI